MNDGQEFWPSEKLWSFIDIFLGAIVVLQPSDWFLLRYTTTRAISAEALNHRLCTVITDSRSHLAQLRRDCMEFDDSSYFLRSYLSS